MKCWQRRLILSSVRKLKTFELPVCLFQLLFNGELILGNIPLMMRKKLITDGIDPKVLRVMDGGYELRVMRITDSGTEL